MEKQPINNAKAETASDHYADIFSSPHWEPAVHAGRQKHPRMAMEKRAAIFASFDALSGYKDEVTETAVSHQNLFNAHTNPQDPDGD